MWEGKTVNMPPNIGNIFVKSEGKGMARAQRGDYGEDTKYDDRKEVEDSLMDRMMIRLRGDFKQEKIETGRKR